ncbi:cytochrome c oxidase assembly protein [Candidatus Mycobacterium wuenschmannii]|uniref:Cytochrome c oxidase assembly protein n=1 Tax=Candidatus Mycobacterium wuenschmannii TaxID=3027808 RepID=A0ABY8W281_9MYCO|nr:cytochrome c oxidase assembly protein [Candidatus Mycobacterium wuenschmannii]WIM89988.1 cytochrome c oxidase assembly protein [Candidatus Mycobacterium wuenschmannii]
MPSSQSSTPEPPARRGSPAWLATGYALAAAGLIGYAVCASARTYLAVGDSYPGIVTAVAERLGLFSAALAGGVTVGGLLYGIVVASPDGRGVIDARAYRAHVAVERSSVVWVLISAAMVIVQAADNAGAAVTRLLGSPVLADAIRVSELSRAWIVVTVAAAVVAAIVRLSLQWVTQCALLLPGFIGVVAVPVSGNAGQGPDHDYSTSAMIVFAAALAALTGLKIMAATNPTVHGFAPHLARIEMVCETAALIYGGLLMSTLTTARDLVDTGYGRAAVAVVTVLTAIWVNDVAALVSARRRAPVGFGNSAQAVAMIAVVALTTSMATQTAPHLLSHRFTTWDVFLGYALPRPPTVSTLLCTWRFDTLIGAGALLLAVVYIAGVIRLRRRGDRWSNGALVAWLAGCLCLLVASSSGVKAYGSAMFSVHMAEHMVLNMFIPVLLVLGGPVSLALRSLRPAGTGAPPGPREWLLWMLHSDLNRFLSHPVSAFVLFVGSLYAVYFTPLFDTLVRYHWGHELMSFHFLLVGHLFFWGIIGIDPGPRRLPFLARLGLLFAVMPFHAFFGIAVMTMTSTIGDRFYRNVDLPWLSSLSADQHLGGAIAWGSSELPVILVVIALVAQWARADRRAATRSDRHADSDYADDELDAYNAMLRELSRNRR